MPRVLAIAIACLLGASLSAPVVFGMSTGHLQAAVTQIRDVPTNVGTAAIRGRVLAAGSGAAVREAEVRVVERNSHFTKATVTDESGSYEITGLPAGRYLLAVTKLGLVSAAYGQIDPGGPSKTLTLQAAQVVADANIKVWRAAVITGVIYSESGEPVPGCQVTVMRAQLVQGQRSLTPLRVSATTSDTGEFRLFGLDPGSYYLVATPPRKLGPTDVVRRKGYAPTFFPGTTRADDATAITVKAEDALSEVFTLTTVRFGSIDGTIIASSLPSGLQVHVRGDGMSAGVVVPVSVAGHFMVSGLVPGEYVLYTNGVPQPATKTPMMFFGRAVVDDNGDAVRGVVLKAVQMITAKGRLVGPSALTPALRSAIHVGAKPFTNTLGPSPGASVREDLSFEFYAWPGRAQIDVQLLTPEWVLKAVRVSGVDVTDEGVVFADGANMDDIEVELTNHPQLVTGIVVGSRGEDVTDYAVVVFSQNRRLWSVQRYAAVGRPDQDGRFLVKSLPPGDYYATALPRVAAADMVDPSFLERISQEATKFTIGEGDVKTLKLEMKKGS